MLKTTSGLQAGQQYVQDMMRSAGSLQAQHRVMGAEDTKEENDERHTSAPKAVDEAES